jgi:hypothetical protein
MYNEFAHGEEQGETWREITEMLTEQGCKTARLELQAPSNYRQPGMPSNIR